MWKYFCFFPINNHCFCFDFTIEMRRDCQQYYKPHNNYKNANRYHNDRYPNPRTIIIYGPNSVQPNFTQPRIQRTYSLY